jgi:hypothetical protein
MADDVAAAAVALFTRRSTSQVGKNTHSLNLPSVVPQRLNMRQGGYGQALFDVVVVTPSHTTHPAVLDTLELPISYIGREGLGLKSGAAWGLVVQHFSIAAAARALGSSP